MGRRIQWLGLGLMLCFALVIGQLVNVQLRQAPRLDAAKTNPRNTVSKYSNFRGEIVAADNTVLARSELATKGRYRYMRTYPQNTLFSGIVGYSSLFYGTAGIESIYNTDLTTHAQSAKTIGQLLNPPPPTTDNVTLTVEPYLQSLARQELSQIASPNKDGAVVVLNPATGAILAMYSNPSFNPNTLAIPTTAKEQAAGYTDFGVKDPEGDYAGRPFATWRIIQPGSTFKMVTTTAVYNLKPTLSGFTFPKAPCIPLPNSNRMLCNDGSTPATANPCGGNLTAMLPASCDPGYAQLGLTLGPTVLTKQSELFGYNARPPIDLTTSFVSTSAFPKATQFQTQTGKIGLAGLAYSAFGQQDVLASPLQQALVASAIADGGTLMTPHLMESIHTSTGTLVERYQPKPWIQSMTQAAAFQDNRLMQGVVAFGTAAGVGFPPTIHAAVKTGTAQTGLPDNSANTHDWMIGFAPATHPSVAVCVAVPYQAVTTSGAQVAGPIMKAMLTAALHPPPGQ